MDYLQIDPRMDEHPDCEEAGFAAVAVFQAVLRAIARNDGQGLLRAKYASPAWLARRMNLRAEDIGGVDPAAWVGRAINRLVQVGMLEHTHDGLRVPGWGKFYSPKKSGSVRTAEWRIRQSGECATVTPVTPRDACDETRHTTSQPSPRDATQHNSTQHNSTKEREAAPPRVVEALAVFGHWERSFQKPRRPPNEEQKTLILERLRDGYSVDELCKAVNGLAASKFHRDKGHTGLKYALGSRDAVDRCMHWAEYPPDEAPSPSKAQALKSGMGSNAWVSGCEAPGCIGPPWQGGRYCYEHSHLEARHGAG